MIYKVANETWRLTGFWFMYEAANETETDRQAHTGDCVSRVEQGHE